jgi:hypothetical protein
MSAEKFSYKFQIPTKQHPELYIKKFVNDLIRKKEESDRRKSKIFRVDISAQLKTNFDYLLTVMHMCK